MGKQSELNFMRQVMLDLSSKDGFIVFRANVGQAWTSSEPPVKLAGGDVLLRNARPFKTGLPKGFHDLFGAKSTVITEDMIGKTVGVFYSVETKTERGAVRPAQKDFQVQIAERGGISLIHRPSDDNIIERMQCSQKHLGVPSRHKK